LFIPQGSEGRIDNGVVKYIGPDCKYVKIGDHCIFSGYSGTQLDMDGEPTLIIINEDFITAKIADTDEIEVKLPLDDDKYISFLYSELCYYLQKAASTNKVETKSRVASDKGATIEKDAWKGST
jgi:hypothetical protein